IQEISESGQADMATIDAKRPKPDEHAKLHKILVDKHPFKVPSPQTVAGILKLVDKTVDKWHLQIKLKGGEREILDPNKKIDLTRPGIERFETVPKECSNG
ncbi:MAG TPA: hypothetical protein PLW48_06975, partial [Alphaproteobacteria bacterium]|nr:hypothetical protein [Alphaproteobacteria bacterium]